MICFYGYLFSFAKDWALQAFAITLPGECTLQTLCFLLPQALWYAHKFSSWVDWNKMDNAHYAHSEIIAIAFAAVAGLVIVSDMGRPDRLINVFVFGRFNRPFYGI
jgi:hypothetical protein